MRVNRWTIQVNSIENPSLSIDPCYCEGKTCQIISKHSKVLLSITHYDYHGRFRDVSTQVNAKNSTIFGVTYIIYSHTKFLLPGPQTSRPKIPTEVKTKEQSDPHTSNCRNGVTEEGISRVVYRLFKKILLSRLTVNLSGTLQIFFYSTYKQVLPFMLEDELKSKQQFKQKMKNFQYSKGLLLTVKVSEFL